MAQYINCYNNYESKDLMEAALEIRKGNLVLFPTETVYGIGANGLDSEAVKSIFTAKGRKQDNPLILHISDKMMLKKIVRDITLLEQKLIDKFFPGPFTIILKKKSIVPDVVTGALDTVGVRMPSNKIAHDLIKLSGVPIAAPSANISGRPSGTRVEDISNELEDKVSYIIDGGPTDIGLESTVVRVINNEVHILRPGKITSNDLLKICDKVVIDSHVLGEVHSTDKVLSPGMKYKHYSPNTKCLLVYSRDNKFISKVSEIENDQKNVIVLCKNHNTRFFKNAIPMGESLEEISKNIFTLLRKVDRYNADLVIIEGVSKQGLGLAIMNRLIRACAYNYIEL